MLTNSECDAKPSGNSPQANKINKRVEVITTDNNEFKETGFGSLETAKAISLILEQRYCHVRFSEIQSQQDLSDVVDRNPDLVVLCIKYILDHENNSKVWLSEYFSHHDVPYTGSDRSGLEFDSNKGKAKTLLLNKGVATAKFFLTHPGLFDSERRLPLPLPLFAKPLDAANGNGIDEESLIHDFESYQIKVRHIFDVYGVSTLAEEILPGREFTVAILECSTSGPRMVMPIEIIVPANAKGDCVLGNAEKSGNREQLLAVEEPTATIIAALADQAFTLLGARDFGRIDIKMDASGKPNFMEINLVPGMTPKTSYFPRACAINNSLPYETVVLKIAELAIARKERTSVM